MKKVVKSVDCEIKSPSVQAGAHTWIEKDLQKSGLSIERIIERVAKTEPNEAIQNYLNKFMVNIKIYGLNPQESISDISRRSASELFTKFMNGILTTIQTSGDLDKLFEYETSQLLQRRDEENVALLNNIGFLSEIYVTILVIAPLLMIILLTTFSFASGSSSGSIIPIQRLRSRCRTVESQSTSTPSTSSGSRRTSTNDSDVRTQVS